MESRSGLAVTFAMLLILSVNGYARANYSISFNDYACIKPYHAYIYKTCHTIHVSIDKYSIIIPQDFETDLASIPRYLWSIMAPDYSNFFSPSILHDYLYTCPNGFTRKQADDIFYKALRDNDVSKCEAYIMYLAVRLFGASSFNEKGLCKKYLIEVPYRKIHQ